MPSPSLVLASRSPARRERLSTLGIAFTCASPDIDESPLPGEPPAQLVERLAIAKAHALAGSGSNALIIGSDQVCVMEGQPIGKPGSFEQARAQLAHSSGRTISFMTGIALLDTRTHHVQSAVEHYHVTFRSLTDNDIEQYLTREMPYECAGSFKMEGLGITLFEQLEGHDPNTLIGLPLIRLCAMLRAAGLDPLGRAG